MLQLRRADVPSGVSPALIQASIDQKIGELKPVPFTSAIDLRQNRKYAKYALIPLLLILVVVFTNAGIITESTHRLVHYDQDFEAEAPFKFIVNENKAMKTVENEDFPVSVKLTGNEIPESVFILVDGNEYKLNRDNTINFSYVFRNVQKSKTFRLSADGFTSKEYTLEVLPNPIVLNFDVELNYPKYTGRKNETLKNTGDLVVPAGIGAVAQHAAHVAKHDARVGEGMRQLRHLRNLMMENPGIERQPEPAHFRAIHRADAGGSSSIAGRRIRPGWFSP